MACNAPCECCFGEGNMGASLWRCFLHGAVTRLSLGWSVPSLLLSGFALLANPLIRCIISSARYVRHFSVIAPLRDAMQSCAAEQQGYSGCGRLQLVPVTGC